MAVDGKRVLVVEDDPMVAEHVCEALERHGATVVGPAPDVAAALRLLSDGRPHAAILDVVLREELVFRVAEALAQQGVPFVFATGHALDTAALNPFETAPCWCKPFDADTLVRLLTCRADT